MNNELKPCPFCGSINLIVGDTKNHALKSGVQFPERIAFVQCMCCCAEAGFYRTKKFGVKKATEMAIEMWNRRQ